MKARTTLDEFYRMFPTERRCWEVLRRVRWSHGFRIDGSWRSDRYRQ